MVYVWTAVARDGGRSSSEDSDCELRAGAQRNEWQQARAGDAAAEGGGRQHHLTPWKVLGLEAGGQQPRKAPTTRKLASPPGPAGRGLREKEAAL